MRLFGLGKQMCFRILRHPNFCSNPFKKRGKEPFKNTDGWFDIQSKKLDLLKEMALSNFGQDINLFKLIAIPIQ
jgi:hypothetical protein